jgi:hypothetical protein
MIISAASAAEISTWMFFVFTYIFRSPKKPQRKKKAPAPNAKARH